MQQAASITFLLFEPTEGTRCLLELELIQTHMTQKPMLRVEVGALGAHQAKNIRGVVGQARMCKAPVWVDVGSSAPAGLLTIYIYFEMDTVHVFSWWWALWCR